MMKISKQILVNKGKCPDCGDTLHSKYRHDFVMCSCGSSGLDGGLDYIRLIGKTISLPLYEGDSFELIRLHYVRGSRGKDGNQPLRWIPLFKMSNDYLKSAIDHIQEVGISGDKITKLYSQELEYREKNSIFITD